MRYFFARTQFAIVLFQTAVLLGFTLGTLCLGTECTAKPIPGTLTIENLRLAAKAASSLEGFLQSLPQEFRSRFVLAYKSRSLQSASFETPRVLLFSSDASLILAYNGLLSRESSGRGHFGAGSAEVVAFNFERCGWDFYRIDFSKILATESGITTNKWDANPQKCTSCHQGKPIWDTYSLWPGFYGSYDDGIKVDSDEGRGFAKFRSLAHQHPLYSKLVGLSDGEVLTEIVRFNLDKILEREGYESLPTVEYNVVHQYTQTHTNLFELFDRGQNYADLENGPRPLEKLSYELTKLNAARITKELAKIPDVHQLSILGLLMGCYRKGPYREVVPWENHLEFLPPGLRENALGKLKTNLENVKERTDVYHQKKLQRLGSSAGLLDGREKNFESKDHLNKIKSSVMYVLEDVGLNMDQWALTLDRKSLSFFHSNYSIDIMDHYLATQLGRKYPEIAAFGFPSPDYFNKAPYCEQIKKLIGATEGE